MNWQFKSISRQSGVSGKSFEPGTLVHCFVFMGNEGLERVDIMEDELESFSIPEKLIGRWVRKVKERSDDNKEEEKQTLGSAEEIFLSLYETESPDHTYEQDLMKQILALMLERKRVLRRTGEKTEDTRTYRHVPTKNELEVPTKSFDFNDLQKITEQLEKIVP